MGRRRLATFDYSAYIDHITDCKDVAKLKTLLIETTRQIGADAIAGYSFPFGGAVATQDGAPLITTFSPTVSDAYRSMLLGADPVMYAAMTLGEPVHFAKIESSLYLTTQAQAVIQTMRDAGLRDGVTTPVFAKPGAYGYFVAAFNEPRPDLTSADLRRIKLLFSEFFYRYRQLTARRQKRLSKRERQVLVAIVNDKTNPQIAEMLGVSEHTVETYVRRCFAKLDVTSRTQAALNYLGGSAFDLPPS